jgi:hypothetical protein
MIAKVQYNDLTGTAAADISDFSLNSLEKYLIDHFDNYDTERYFCVGCRLNLGGQTSTTVSIRFICLDKEEHKYVYLCPADDMSYEEAFSMFKRFDIVLGSNESISEIVVSDEDWRDLK